LSVLQTQVDGRQADKFSCDRGRERFIGINNDWIFQPEHISGLRLGVGGWMDNLRWIRKAIDIYVALLVSAIFLTMMDRRFAPMPMLEFHVLRTGRINLVFCQDHDGCPPPRVPDG
jgi:hypothetical protein